MMSMTDRTTGQMTGQFMPVNRPFICFIIVYITGVTGHNVNGTIFLSFFFLIWGGTCSLRMPALRPASQAGPMRNPRERTSVVLRNTLRRT